jgi:hypothetical protein
MSEFTRYPNQFEIAEQCALIQSDWTPAERDRRQHSGMPLWFVQLLLETPSQGATPLPVAASDADALPDRFVPAPAFSVVAAHAAL